MEDFKDRVSESTEIIQLLNSDRFELLILYGRRRIGKTALGLHTTKNRKRIYFLAERYNNLSRFQQECAKVVPRIDKFKQDLAIILENLADQIEVLIIDEFQNMIIEDSNIPYILQRIIDGPLQKTKLKLILMGSSVSLMTSKVLADPSPLFGRKTAALKLQSIPFCEIQTFFPTATFQELVEIYCFADGIPFYLTMIDVHAGFWAWLQEELKKKAGFLNGEMDFLLRYEFTKPEGYMRILEGIAWGRTKLNHIADTAKMKVTDVPQYLHTLIEVNFIKREVPILDSPMSRNGRYFLMDHFIRFWFRFIFPNRSSIEQGIFNVDIIRDHYSEYIGPLFETIVKEILIRSNEFPCDQIGRWWKKAIEIDLIAYNRKADAWLFVECKYSNRVNVNHVLKALSEKIEQFPSKHLKQRYLIAALSFEKKITQWNGTEVWCWDALDLDAKMRMIR